MRPPTGHKFPPGLDPVSFRERGYTIVKGLFEAEEVQQLRDEVVRAFADMQTRGRVGTDPGREGVIRGLDSDLLSLPPLRHVLLNPRLLRAIGELLGGEPVYFGDSSARIGGNGVRAWHRDNVNRTRRRGPDWQGPYPLLRCGLYLQDHSVHSGGLAVRPHSYQTKRLLPTIPKLVASRAGDLVAWNMRTAHTGEVVRVRGIPNLPLNPRVQARLPEAMRVPEEDERVVLFMAFGLPSAHLDNYVGYLRTRHYMQRTWSRSRFGPEVWKEAEAAGLHVLQPIPAYGVSVDAEKADMRPKRGDAPQPVLVGSLRPEAMVDRATELLAAIVRHPAVASLAHSGYRLIDFVEPRMRQEIVDLLRGWALARDSGALPEQAPGTGASPALLMGARASLGLNPGDISYAGRESRSTPAAMRQVMRGLAAVSRPESVRIAAVVTGDLARALGEIPAADLHSTKLGVLPFPGLEGGAGVRFVLRRRCPLLTAYGSRVPGPGVAVRLPNQLGLVSEPELDEALTMLVSRQMAHAAPEQDQAIRALGGLHRTHSLRALLLPDLATSASRLLVAYAHDRGLRVGVLGHDASDIRELEVGHGPSQLEADRGEGERERMYDWHETFDAVRFSKALSALAR